MTVNIGTTRGSRSKASNRSRSNSNAATTVPNEGAKARFGKVGSIIGKVGSLAEKYGGLIPGVGSVVQTIGKVASSINDPEWWMNYPVNGVTTNVALASDFGTPLAPGDKTCVIATGNAAKWRNLPHLRPSVLEFLPDRLAAANTLVPFIPAKDDVSTYVLQNVRKVSNAVLLQDVDAYAEVLANSARAAALYYQLRKFIYLTEHSKPWIPALTDGSFPILAAENKATLVSLADSLRTYIQSSVRIPHTLSCYLAWRFGRVFNMGQSEKTGIVLYNVIAMNTTVESYSSIVAKIIAFNADQNEALLPTTTLPMKGVKTSAQADLYNAYMDHVFVSEIEDEKQYMYDPKEWVLRTNMDLVDDDIYCPVRDTDEIYMDSALDNPTVFMASTVSTGTKGGGVGKVQMPLFPVGSARFWGTGMYAPAIEGEDVKVLPANRDYSILGTVLSPTANLSKKEIAYVYGKTGGAYKGFEIDAAMCNYGRGIGPNENVAYTDKEARCAVASMTWAAALCKATEYYNVEINMPWPSFLADSWDPLLPDATAPASDLAIVPESIIKQTQRYAFANLVCDVR